MGIRRQALRIPAVALLAEGVDRNLAAVRGSADAGRSPSSRRAWIEMGIRRQALRIPAVALLAEGVDRNILPTIRQGSVGGRPPRGGRG